MINFHSQLLHIDAKLQEYVSEKLNHLKHYNDTITSLDIYFKLDNKHEHIKDKVVEIKCHVPHHTYFVEHTSKTFEESFEHTYKSLVNKMTKENKKLKSHH